MAREYKQPSIVSGLSVKDILNMSIEKFNSLKLPDLRKVVGRLVSAGNKRLRTFERTGETSPATRYVEKSGGKFSTKGKTLNELRAEFARIRNFFSSSTSTVKGARQVRSETIKRLKEKGVQITAEHYNELWQAYEQLKESNPDVAIKGIKYRVQSNIANALQDGLSVDAAVQKVRQELVSIYEEQAELVDEYFSTSEFFEL